MARIALVCEPPDGGVAEHVARLAAGLGEHGHETVVFDARRLPLRRDYAHPHLDARSLGMLVRALKRFDLVHAHAAKAGVVGRLAARMRGLPAVYTPHCFPFVGEVSQARRRFGLVVERGLAPVTTALICVCEDEREVARAAGIRAPLHVVHNGCPPCEPPARRATPGMRARTLARRLPGPRASSWGRSRSCGARSDSTSCSRPRRGSSTRARPW